MKKIISLALCTILAAGLLAGCGSDKTASSVKVADEEYYQKFKDQGLSINVYNWGEYISDGSEPDTADVNKEFEKLTGITVNYEGRRSGL